MKLELVYLKGFILFFFFSCQTNPNLRPFVHGNITQLCVAPFILSKSVL